jgi:hypothetical protein
MQDDTTPSGRFVVRIPPDLHAQLRAAASALGISLNEHCAALLSTSGGVGSAEPLVQRVIDKARATLGDRLAGVVLFGSWARADVSTDSDIDVLLVAHAGIPIVRSLYQQWDTEPLAWDTHAVEPHIVALPETAEITSGLWAEVALDGIVIHDPQLMVSRMLANVRRRILDEQLVRRSSGGQTYWVGAR